MKIKEIVSKLGKDSLEKEAAKIGMTLKRNRKWSYQKHMEKKIIF